MIRLPKKLASILHPLTCSFCGKLVPYYEPSYGGPCVKEMREAFWPIAKKEFSPANNYMSELGSKPTSVKLIGETVVPADTLTATFCDTIRYPETAINVIIE